MKRLDRWLSLGLALTLGLMLGMLGLSLWDKMPSPVEHVAWSPKAQWIGPQKPSYRFYARQTFYLSDQVQTGWLRISADNNFILYVNGNLIGEQTTPGSSSLGFASHNSFPNQSVNDSAAYEIKNTHVNVAYPRNWKYTFYIDLTNSLRPGKNVIALEIQKARINPRVVVEGAIHPVSKASPINLTTGVTSWKVSNLSENHQGLQWFDIDFLDQSWAEAKAISPIQEATYSRLSQHIFDRSLQGNWITGVESTKGEVWLRSHWQVPQKPQRAFIRFSGDGEYALTINDSLVKRYGVNDGNQLHMYEVTSFLHTGNNILSVRLAHPLDQDFFKTQKNSLNFFLDGWVEDQNNITAPIATDSTWSTLSEPVSGWVEGSAQGQPAIFVKLPQMNEFQHQFEGNAYLLNYPDYLWHNSLWSLAGISWALVSAWCLGRFLLVRLDSWWDSFAAGAGLLMPGTLFLICIGLLKHRYAEAERGLFFAQPQSNALIMLGFVGIVLLTLLWSQVRHRSRTFSHWGLWFLLGLVACLALSVAVGESILPIFLGFSGILVLNWFWRWKNWRLRDDYTGLQQAWLSGGQWFVLISIIVIGFALRAYDLGFTPPDSDESTSLDTIRGILRTGAPIATSGVWYTRSPLYHYIVALWLHLIGFSAVNARFPAAVFGTATLLLMFIFTREVTGKNWLSLVTVAILSIDPWELMYSRNMRFYSLIQVLTILAFWSFYKGFINKGGKVYQYTFFIAITGCLLSQEGVGLMLVPCFFMGFLYFYRPFNPLLEWQIILGSFMTFVIYTYDGIFFLSKCLTPLEGLSYGANSLLQLHLSDIAGFTGILFVGSNRMNILYSLFFVLGFIYFLRYRETKLIFLFGSVFIFLIDLTLMFVQVSGGYNYANYPLFVMLSIYSAFCIAESFGRRFEFVLNSLIPLRNIALGCVALLILNNIEPDRVLASYQDILTRNDVQVFEYIRHYQQPGDVVIANSPPAAAIALGRLDYFLSPQSSIGFDRVYMHEGRLIERIAGGVAVTNVDQLSHILEKANRVWIQLGDKPKPNSEQAWDYDYLYSLGQPVFEAYGTILRLWQRQDSIIPRLPNTGKDLGIY